MSKENIELSQEGGIDDNKIPENEKLIQQATSFEELKSIITDKQISIAGTREVFSPEALIDIISNIQQGHYSLEMATRSNGFREKLKELLELEKDKENKS